MSDEEHDEHDPDNEGDEYAEYEEWDKRQFTEGNEYNDAVEHVLARFPDAKKLSDIPHWEDELTRELRTEE